MSVDATRSASPTSEDGILACIDSYFPKNDRRLSMGRGDDCAILQSAASGLCLSSDMFIEDVHFRRDYFSPFETGYKALAVNLSDLAAFGARPVAFNLCLGLPKDMNMDWLHGFFQGMASLAKKYDLALAGGDLSRSDSLHIAITIIGEKPEGHNYLRRATVQPQDIIFVVGTLGLARAGLTLLEKHGRMALERWPKACMAHLMPVPQVEAGLLLSRRREKYRPVTLMDVSDGILRDLPRLLGWTRHTPSKAPGAALELADAQLSPELLAYARDRGLDPVREALAGGEDYALLGACESELFSELATLVPGLWQIGQVTDAKKIYCNGQPIDQLAGFDHFSHAGLKNATKYS